MVEKEYFDKNIIESFLESALVNLPKEAIMTDGASMYSEILDKMGIKHQLSIFYIVKNHHTKTFSNISRVSKRIRTIYNTIATNETTIEELRNQIRYDNLTKKQKSKKRNKIDNLKCNNKDLRNERSGKKNELKELLATNECVKNIYNANDKKSSQRRHCKKYHWFCIF